MMKSLEPSGRMRSWPLTLTKSAAGRCGHGVSACPAAVQAASAQAAAMGSSVWFSLMFMACDG